MRKRMEHFLSLNSFSVIHIEVNASVTVVKIMHREIEKLKTFCINIGAVIPNWAPGCPEIVVKWVFITIR